MSEYACRRRDRPQNPGSFETYPENETSLQLKCYAAQLEEVVTKIPAALGRFGPSRTSTVGESWHQKLLKKQLALRPEAARALHLHAASAALAPRAWWAGWLQGTPHSHPGGAAKISGVSQGSTLSRPNLMLSLLSTVSFSLRRYKWRGETEKNEINQQANNPFCSEDNKAFPLHLT